MNRLTMGSLAIAIALLGTSHCISGEPKPGLDYRQLKAMEWIIGDWEADWEVPSEGESALSGWPAGAKVHATTSWKWMENKSYIMLRFRSDIDGKVAHKGFEVVAVDPQSKKIVQFLFSILGGSGTGEWSVDGKTWTLKWSGMIADQTKLEGVAHLVPIDKDTYTWQLKEVKKNGQNAAGTPVVTYRRVAKKPG